ncbi:Insect cuticle protein [Trinorchestia longiramus]|nr:Insect cuticle protein [Trinorchestia longiramus]
MRAVIFATLLALAAARPDEQPYGDDSDEVQIVRDERVYPSASGEYSLDFETSDGTVISESGDGTGPDGAVESQGSIRFIHPDGESFELTYVANAEGGYQPESSALPVAPAFPHPIPQFVLDQIAFAAEEDARRAAEPEAGSDDRDAGEQGSDDGNEDAAAEAAAPEAAAPEAAAPEAAAPEAAAPEAAAPEAAAPEAAASEAAAPAAPSASYSYE